MNENLLVGSAWADMSGDLLEKLLEDSPVLLLHGPPQSGKRFLLEALARSQKSRSVIWVGEDVPLLGPGEAVVTDDYGVALELAAASKEPMLLVVDGLHCGERGFSPSDLADLVAGNPLVRCVASCQAWDVGALAFAAVVGGIKSIGLQEFGFTRQEVLGLAEADGVRVHHGALDTAMDFSGWPLIVQRAAKELSLDRDLSEARLEEQILRAPLELVGTRRHRQFLTAVAVCPGLKVDVFAAFVGVPAAEIQEVARELVGLGLLVAHPKHPEGSYLVPEALERGLLKSASLQWSLLDRETLRRLCLRDQQQGSPAVAAFAYLDLRDYAGLEAVLAKAFAQLLLTGLEGGPNQGLARRIAELPLEAIRDFPLLLAYRIKAIQLDGSLPDTDVEDAAAESVAGLSRGQWANVDTDIHLAASLIGARAVGDRQMTLALLKDVDSLLSTRAGAVEPAREHSFLLIEAGSANFELGALEEAQALITRAMEEAKGFSVLQAYIWQRIALIRAWRLDVEGADAAIRAVGRTLEAEGLQVPRLFWASSDIAKVMMSVASLAEEDVHSAQEAARRVGPHAERVEFLGPFLFAEAAHRRRERGSLEAFLVLRDRLDDPAFEWRLPPIARGMLRTLQASYASFAGEYTLCQETLESVPPVRALSVVEAQARLALLTGNPLEALRLLWEAGPVFHTRSPDKRGFLLGAVALHVLGEEGEAEDWFREVVESDEGTSLLMDIASVPYRPLLELAELVRSSGGPDVVATVKSVPATHRVPFFGTLSAAELTLARELETGDTLQEIADRLFISRNTAKTQLRCIYRKLGVNTRQSAAEIVRRRYPT